LKILLEQIQNDWNSLKDKLEIDIIEKYAYSMRLFAIAVLGKNINYHDIFIRICTRNIILFHHFY